ncbi:unnamed protein product [Musa acuminata subsp. malaccensis]|uniref:(wild Malaysian banana) hypothetical protein n=1 Tax=Musa acuminata subsp. malaccensis TaxID=214687 RepID=A0A804J5U9_MUSAM|nr:unnamed protein product [Musa acuminata subsp. malaccensis]
MPPQDGAPVKDTNLRSTQRMIYELEASCSRGESCNRDTVEEEATIEVQQGRKLQKRGSYNDATIEKKATTKEERWGSAGERNTRDATAEGNGRWYRVAVEKIVIVHRGGKIYRTDGLTMEKQ